MADLNFYSPQLDRALVVTMIDDRVKLLIRFGMNGEEEFTLDRLQSHKLMLYLQERLKCIIK